MTSMVTQSSELILQLVGLYKKNYHLVEALFKKEFGMGGKTSLTLGFKVLRLLLLF